MKQQVLAGIGILIGASVLYGQTIAEYHPLVFPSAEGKLFGSETLGSQIVSDKPFSATEERHTLQVLGDGTHIETGETNRLYRDDRGRTRIEQVNGNITIFDPVAGFRAELNPVTKTESRTNITVREGRVTQIEGRVVGRTPVTYTAAGTDPEVLKGRLAKLKEELEQMQKQYTARYPGVLQLQAQIADVEKALQISSGQVRIYKEAAEAAALYEGPTQREGLSGGEPTLTVIKADTTDRLVVTVGSGDNATMLSLPAQMVNGALAQGTRMTETIPVGKIGNDRAISIVNERWYSGALQMLVKSTSSDPRFGDTTFQLTNIVQAAPDPSLFQIPPDYTVRK